MPVIPESISGFAMGAVSAIMGYLFVAVNNGKRFSFLALATIASIWMLFGVMLGMFPTTAPPVATPYPERTLIWAGMYIVFVIAQLSAPKSGPPPQP